MVDTFEGVTNNKDTTGNIKNFSEEVGIEDIILEGMKLELIIL